MKFKVEYFKKQGGEIPVEEFILAQGKKMRMKIYRMLLLLEEFGNELREPYSKVPDEGIFELRVKEGANISRILYFFISGRKIILINGFTKKTQKTPKRDNSCKKA